MKNYIIKVQVDENTLRKETNNYTSPIERLVELVIGCGVSVTSIEAEPNPEDHIENLIDSVCV